MNINKHTPTEQLIALAKEAFKHCYSTTQFRLGYKQLYNQLLYRKTDDGKSIWSTIDKPWIDDRVKYGDTTLYSYVIISESKKLCYVGITKNLKRREHQHMMMYSKSCRSLYVCTCKDAKFIECKSGIDPHTEETRLSNYYKTLGYTIVNVESNYGKVGQHSNFNVKYDEDTINQALIIGNHNFANAYLLFPKMFNQYIKNNRKTTSFSKMCKPYIPDVEYVYASYELYRGYKNVVFDTNRKIIINKLTKTMNNEQLKVFLKNIKRLKGMPSHILPFVDVLKPLVYNLHRPKNDDPIKYGFHNSCGNKYPDHVCVEAAKLCNNNIANMYAIFPKIITKYANNETNNTSVHKMLKHVTPDLEYALVGAFLNKSLKTKNFKPIMNTMITRYGDDVTKQKLDRILNNDELPSNLKPFLHHIQQLIKEVTNE